MDRMRRNSGFFQVRWELFCTAEIFRQVEDTECLRNIQQNIVKNELQRIAEATEALDASASDFLRN